MLVDFTKELTSEDVWFRNGLFWAHTSD
jgi:hypothetical protein